MTEVHHKPLYLFDEATTGACLIILNSNLYGLETVIKGCWNHFSTHVCADGGAITLYNAFDEAERARYIPSYICGDLDSLSSRCDVQQYYTQRGTTVVEMADQNATDLSKTLDYVTKKVKPTAIYAMNALWGRFDHILGAVATLYSFPERYSIPVYLMSEVSLVFLLQPGYHTIKVDSGYEEGHCGLVPIGSKCVSCTTTGLKWNLNNNTMEMGGLISTSNLIDTGVQEVTIINSDPLLWTMSHLLVSRP